MQSEDQEREWRCWGPQFLQATVLLRSVHDTGGFEGRTRVRVSVAETLSRSPPSGSFPGGPVEGMVANQDCTIFGTRILQWNCGDTGICEEFRGSPKIQMERDQE